MGKWVIIFFVILGTLISVFTTSQRLANFNKDRPDPNRDKPQKKDSGLKLSIYLLRQSYCSVDEIIIQTSLTNIADTPQNIIFDTSHPSLPYSVSLFQPQWYKSVLRCANWQFLSQNVEMEEEWLKRLKPYQRLLKVGQSIIKQCELREIAPLENNNLLQGTYTLCLSFGDIQSNQLTFTIDSLGNSLN